MNPSTHIIKIQQVDDIKYQNGSTEKMKIITIRSGINFSQSILFNYKILTWGHL